MTSSVREFESEVPPSLVAGRVRPWQLLFLYAAIMAATGVATMIWAREADLAWRFAVQPLAFGISAALLLALVTALVPELRRSLPALYRRPVAMPTWRETLLFIGMTFTWANGAYPVLFVLPLLSWQPQLAEAVGYTRAPQTVAPIFFLSFVAVAVLVAPVSEELMFRGYLQNLWRRRWGVWTGILLSALVFGLWHLQGAVFAGVMGVAYSLVYLRTRSLWPGTMLHALHNLVVAPFALSHFFAWKDPAAITAPAAWIPEILMTVAFFPLAYFFWRRFRPDSSPRHRGTGG
jgi:membrane protease YdiL (CAAX protease family)